MRSDSAFVIGQAHQDTATACQDYALAGRAGAMVWAAVSDGCSSAGLTDIGSRIWVHAARQALNGLSALPASPAQLLAPIQARAAAMLQPFSFEDGYATLGLLLGQGSQARAAVFGDGHLALLQRDGGMQCWELRYDNNAPRYPAYALDAGRRKAWRALAQGTQVQVAYRLIDTAGWLVTETLERHAAPDFPGLWLAWDDVRDVQALLVCTDGAASFGERSPQQILHELLQVKSPTGQFMQRRLGALARGWRKGRAAPPHDDLGVAALWFDAPPADAPPADALSEQR